MRKRKNRIEVYFTDDELRKLSSKVKRSGLKREEYVREILAGKDVKEQPKTDFFDVLRELRRIGNNLNQLTAYINTTGKIEYNAVAECAEQLKNVLSKMLTEAYG